MKTLSYMAFIALMVTLALDSPVRAQSIIEQLDKAYKKERDKDFDGAIKVYERIIADTNADRRFLADAHYRLAMCYLKKEDKNKAIEQFQRFVSEFPKADQIILDRAKQKLKRLRIEVASEGTSEDNPVKSVKESKEPPKSTPKKQDRSSQDVLSGLEGLGKEYPPRETVTLKILDVTDKSMEQAIVKKLKKMTDSKYNSASWYRRDDVLTVELAPIKNITKFVKKIRFGSVTSIKKRTVVVSILGKELFHDDGLESNNSYYRINGHAVKFETPEPGYSLTAVRVNGLRMPGDPKPTEKNFHIFVCDKDSKVIADFPFPHARFKLRKLGWVTLKVKPTKIPEKFIIYFVAKKTIGVNCDTQGTGNSFSGLPGAKLPPPFSGNWMIRAVVKSELSKDTKAKKTSTSSSTKVEGKISGTNVTLKNASFQNGQLAIYAGDNWGTNPSVLIFLFTEEGAIPGGKLFSVKPKAEPDGTAPHVHYRWKNAESKQIETEIVMDGYRLRLKFDKAVDGKIPGEILFEIPEKDTRIQGRFIAEIKD